MDSSNPALAGIAAAKSARAENLGMGIIGTEIIGIIGLGYVGLPLALAFAEHFDTFGFDINAERVHSLRTGHDLNGDVAAFSAAISRLRFCDALEPLGACSSYIVTVPTPVNADKKPDLEPLQNACAAIGKMLKRGDLVVFESTVFPGCTEEICAPILQRISGLRPHLDFDLGYSPERINPGDKHNSLSKIVKLTSGGSPRASERVDALYRRIITAGTYKAADIRTAEAAKVIENVQRDVNIALANECAKIFKHLGLDSEAVFNAACSKWNYLDFRPGLVGGHCIGVDPYYLIDRAQRAGYFPELIATARRVNESMASYIVGDLLRMLARHQQPLSRARVAVLGASFKENCGDTRNARALDIARELAELGANVSIYDPWVSQRPEVTACTWIDQLDARFDLLVLAVRHQQFVDLGAAGLQALLTPTGLIYDVKRVLPASYSQGRL
jgi:UDP-N-acetyl-D-glucosamine/UDP-N-acetyl-D-galactosamine dehydrogenase